MSLKEKFEQWSTKVAKGSMKYAAWAYAPEENESFQVRANEKLVLNWMYVGVFDEGKPVNSFYHYVAMESGAQGLPKVAVIIKNEKEIICNIGEEYYSNQNKDKSKEIIILYSSRMHTEFIFAAPKSIPYMVADYGTPNGESEFRFRYTELLIEGALAYITQKQGTGALLEIPIDMGAQLYEEGTDEE